MSYRLDSINETTRAIRADLVRKEEKEQNTNTLSGINQVINDIKVDMNHERNNKDINR